MRKPRRIPSPRFSRRVTLILLLATGAVTSPPLVTAEGKEFVDRKAGFRLEIPPGWHTVKVEKAIAGFKGPNFVLFIKSEVAKMTPQKYLPTVSRNLAQTFPSYRKVSEETVVLGGLPARKLVYTAKPHDQRLRAWFIALLSRPKFWSVSVVSPDRRWPATNDPEYKQMEELLASIQFLEPVLGRLKAGVPRELANVEMTKLGADSGSSAEARKGMEIVSNLPLTHIEPDDVLVNIAEPAKLIEIASHIEPDDVLVYIAEPAKLIEIASNLPLRRIEPHRVLDGEYVRDRAVAEDHSAQPLQPSSANAHFELALSFQQKGDWASAIVEFREHLRKHPDDAEAHYHLAFALSGNSDLEAAIREEHEALRLRPSYAEAHFHLGLALKEKGELDSAIAEFREALRLHLGDSSAEGAVVSSVAKQADPGRPFSKRGRGPRLHPTSADAHYELATTLAQKGDLDSEIGRAHV